MSAVIQLLMKVLDAIKRILEVVAYGGEFVSDNYPAVDVELSHE